jgi:hypothetical protein
MDNFTIFDCHILHLPKINSRAGNITAVNNLTNIPFAVKRVYYLYDIPSGSSRGAHGHKELESLIVAISGSFDITIDDGFSKKTVQLNRPDVAFNLKPGIWRELSNFSSSAICFVMASDVYREDDYLNDYAEFLTFKGL